MSVLGMNVCLKVNNKLNNTTCCGASCCQFCVCFASKRIFRFNKNALSANGLRELQAPVRQAANESAVHTLWENVAHSTKLQRRLPPVVYLVAVFVLRVNFYFFFLTIIIILICAKSQAFSGCTKQSKIKTFLYEIMKTLVGRSFFR